MTFQKNLKSPSFKQKGATIIEYALLASLIAVVAISALTLVGEEITATFEEVAASLNTPA